MYAAGTYLGGTQALGGTGRSMTFAQRLKDPKLLANLVKFTRTWSFGRKRSRCTTKDGL